MVDVEGPFLSLPTLRAAWPALDPLDKNDRQALRNAHAAWQRDPNPRQWLQFVLADLLGWGEDLHWNTDDALDAFVVNVSEHDTRLVPSFVLNSPNSELKPDAAEILGMVLDPGSHPAARITGESWSATPIDRMARLCRHHGVPLGLLTDGRWWTLVAAPRSAVTSTATFDAIGWPEAAERLVVRAFRSLLRRERFFAVPSEEKLAALLEASKDTQEDLTERLGVQVRQAVELLVGAVGRADTEDRRRGGDGLTGVDAHEVYRGCVTTLMRLIFLLFAEERGLLPSDRELYASSYSAGRLCADLEKQAVESGEEGLEHVSTAWHRLLALFDAVYYGVRHPRLLLYPHDGSLFDTTNFPWFPRNIDDRTVLHMLRAMQYVQTGTGVLKERRKLSFRELNVEQIGYMYEGLLAYDGYRADETTVGLIGKAGVEAEVPLRELQELAAHCTEKSELAAALVARYKSSGIGSAKVLERKLAGTIGAREGRDLLAATRGDALLAERLRPFYTIIRKDMRGIPFLILPGELFITESSLRKNSGTHYSPRSLAEEVVERALAPLVYSPGPLETSDRTRWKLKTPNEILALKVVDIAMGSGAFLVAAANYLGDRLIEAQLRNGDSEALLSRIDQLTSEVEVDHDPAVIRARRAVIENCLYGVDINPAAVEITKVSLWLISFSPELPFTFLDDRLKTGDSLVGLCSEQQIWHMHVVPERGDEGILFDWVEPSRSLLERLADDRRRVAEIQVDVKPLQRLAEKRKLLTEIDDRVAELRLVADLLIGSALAHARQGFAGLDGGAAEAANLASNAVRHGDVEPAQRQAHRWLSIDQTEDWFERRPFHWPLEFPEVFQQGGFDGVIGNWPYLGGQKLTGVLGQTYREYLVHVLGRGVRGSADLIAYFVLRSSELVKPDGTIGLVATNTLAQGDTRQVGLEQLVADGVTIYDAIKSKKWPAKLALECCVVWATRRGFRAGQGKTALLDPPSRVSGAPNRLIKSRGIAFIGSYVLGLGFTMEPEKARELLAQDERNSEVLFPYLNGQDINSTPDVSARRWVINFHDWPEERALRYSECYAQVRREVKPERAKNKDKSRRETWWRFTRPAPELYEAIVGLDRVVVLTLVSKTVMPVLVPTGQVFSHMLAVFASEDAALLGLLSSAPHYWWAVTRSSTLETRVRYTPSDAFETFPLPELTEELRRLGAELNEFRRGVMLSRKVGLTKTYNLVFDETCRDVDIEELRRIHRDVDAATIRAYGWEDRIAAVGGLNHGFHPVGRETRYTIGPAAQREILDSLLELNHELHRSEAAGPPRGTRAKAGKRSARQQELGLDNGPADEASANIAE